MRRKSSAIAFFLITAFCAQLAALDVDLNGVWNITMDSPSGTVTREMRITQNGTELTVLMQSNRGELVEYEGSVNGDQVQWSGVRSTPRGTFTVTFTGTINGDAMSGAVDFGGWYSGSWNAQR